MTIYDIYAFMHLWRLWCIYDAFQTLANNYDASAAWSAFHLKHTVVVCVSSELMKCRLLKWFLDHPGVIFTKLEIRNLLIPCGSFVRSSLGSFLLNPNQKPAVRETSDRIRLESAGSADLYMYIGRERERERERGRERERDMPLSLSLSRYMCIYIYIYIYTGFRFRWNYEM